MRSLLALGIPVAFVAGVLVGVTLTRDELERIVRACSMPSGRVMFQP